MTTPTVTLDASQLRAVDLMCTARVGVITGGPGTGKTTTTRAALDRMDAAGERYLLAAPTGKAARRMSEATGRTASTIHRLLAYGLGSPWGRCAHNPLEAECVIVDESSMVDVELAAALLDAIDPETTRLIWVGDRNQLPSVGPGRVFADVIDSGRVPVAELTTLHRAAAESWVCGQAPVVLAGKRPDLTTRADFQWSPAPSAHAAAQAALSWARQLGAQVLAPQRTTDCGTSALNRIMQAAMNPPRQGELVFKVKGGEDAVELRVGDRVIQTRNDYEIGVMNGECGVVVAVQPGGVLVDIEGTGEVTFTGLAAHRLQLAYALTIHKSQGSEWPWVVVLCHSSHSYMLSRALIYTAITRAKQGVVLVGDDTGLERALGNTKDSRRNTTLAARIQHYATAQDEPARAYDTACDTACDTEGAAA